MTPWSLLLRISSNKKREPNVKIHMDICFSDLFICDCCGRLWRCWVGAGTALTLTLTGGSLEISAPATADLGSAVTSSAGTVVAVVVLSGALFRSLRARRRRRSL